MPEVSSLKSHRQLGRSEIEARLDQFETAWRRGTVPSLDAFLPPANDPARRELLEELIKIDLEYRWNVAGRATRLPDRPTVTDVDVSLPPCPRLEDYVAHFPELGPLQSLPVELVGEEYRVRQLWGDRPEHAEYVARFAGHTELHHVLGAIDNDLAAESPGNELISTIGRGRRARPLSGSAVGAWPVVAGFEILGVLGHGGMGVVYRARQLGLNRMVALKMILATAQTGADQVARFRAEAEAQARLQHPHIVQIYEIGECEGRPYFALELLDGGSLAQKLAGTPQPVRAAAALVETLARAMHVAHGCGLVHRDLKPLNILLTTDGTPKISDFGLAKRLEGNDNQTATGAVIGTPVYMAPEQAAGQSKRIGPAADVHALGVILYEMLTGRPPFLAETALDTLLQVRSEEPVPPGRLRPNLPRDVETICLQCLQKQPEQRYASAAALADDLHRFLAGEPIQARPVGRMERFGRWCLRNPVVAGLTAAAVLFLLAGAAVSTFYAIQAQHSVNQARQALAAESKRRQQTRAALDLLSSQFIDDLLARQTELSLEHRRFLEKAVASYEELADDSGQDEASRAGVAGAHLRIGNIRRRLGQMAEAENAYRRSEELYRQLAADFPTWPAYRQEMASSLGGLGIILRETGRAGDAEQAHRTAQVLQEQLVSDFPSVPEYRRSLALGHNNLGILLQTTGRLQDAARSHEDAVTLQRQLVADSPSVPEYRQDLARSLGNLATLQMRTGQMQAAEQGYREALQLRQELATQAMAVPQRRQDLAMAHHNLGALLQTTGRMQEAEQAYHEALKLQQQLVAEFPAVPEYCQDLANSHNILGAVHANTGRLQEAEADFRAALKLRQQLTADFPSMHIHRKNVVESHTNLGKLLFETGRAQDAEQEYREAYRIAQQLAAEFSTVPQYRQWQARSLYSLGVLLMMSGRTRDSEQHFRDALNVQRQLATELPAVPQYRHELARSYNGLGDLYRSSGKSGDAEASVRNALRLLQQLAAEFPAARQYRQELATSHSNLGDLLRTLERPQDAEREYRDALQLRQRLASDFPTLPDYQNELAKGLMNLADLLRSRNELEPARKLLEQAAIHHQSARKANPRHPDYRQALCNNRTMLTETLLGLGDHAAAADTAAQLIQAATDPANDGYNAACFLSRCVPLAKDDAQLLEAERSRLAQTYADRAVATLQQAMQNGYKDVDHMKKDPDLDPLRSRDDFQKLLAGLCSG